MIRQVFAIAGKELRLFLRDPGALALTFLMPFMFIVVMSAALQGMFDPEKGNPVELLVVNEDRGPQADRVLDQLGALQAFRLRSRWQGRPLDRETAARLVTERDRAVALVFPTEFSQVLTSPKAPTRPARVEILVDPVASLQYVAPIRGVVAGVLRQTTYLAAVPEEVESLLQLVPVKLSEAQRQEILSQAQQAFAPDRLARRARRVTVERSFPAGMSLSDYPDTFQQNVPGYTIFGIFWIVTLLASSILAEKRAGTFRRIEAAPVSRAALLAGKLVPYYGICAAQLLLMLGAGNLLYDMSLGRSWVGLASIGLATAASATSLGVLVAALVRTEAQATSLTTLMLLSLAALGGCFVPRFIMPEWLRSASLVTPHGWSLDGFQDLLVRGQGLGAVLPEVAVLLGFSAGFFLLGVWRFRFE
jgi:ABC-2 type transport system permease protein